MRITGVHTAVVEANYDWTYVRVDAEGEGLSGLGECFCAPGLTAIIRDLAPLLIGEDARDVDRLWAKLRWGCSGAGSAAGIVYNAISGIEAALWDLVGQHYGVPIYRLLGGGKFRDSVRMYADCHAGEALHSMNALMIERPARWGQEGPDAIAVGAIRNPEHGRAYAKAAPGRGLHAGAVRRAGQAGGRRPRLQRAEVRPRRAHAVHAGHGFGHAVAGRDQVHGRAGGGRDRRRRRRGRRGLRLPLALPGRGRAAARARAGAAGPDVAGGPGAAGERAGAGAGDEVDHDDRSPPARTATCATASARRSRAGAIDVAAPDPQKTGGLLETRRIADYADTHYISMAPHCIASPIGTVANVHVCAAIPNFLALEWHGMSVPFWNDLAEGWDDGPVIDGGRIKVPEAPGLGVTLNLDLARQYARPGEPFFDE